MLPGSPCGTGGGSGGGGSGGAPACWDDGTAEGRLGGIARAGYLGVAARTEQLSEVLDKIKVGIAFLKSGWEVRCEFRRPAICTFD